MGQLERPAEFEARLATHVSDAGVWTWSRCEDVGKGFCAASVDGYCVDGFDGPDGKRYCHG